MSTATYSALKGDELLLKYLIRQPKNRSAEKPPLLLLLHGVGGNETNLFTYAEQWPEEYLVIAARAPFALSATGFAWFQVDFSTGKPEINAEQAEKSRLVLKQFISQLTEKYGVDEKRIYLGGFSQGAIMSASVALTTPEKIAGIAMLSGRILPEIKPLVKPSPALSALKVFLAHGVQDSKLGIHYAREAKTYLQELKVQLQYHEYEMDHYVGKEELKDLLGFLKN